MESGVQYSNSPPSYAPTATAPAPQQHPSATGQAPNDEHPYEKLRHVASPAPPTYDYPRSTPYPTAPNTYPAPAQGTAPYSPQYYPPPAQYPPPPQQYPLTSGQVPYAQPLAGAPPQAGYGTPQYAVPAPPQQQQQQQVVVVAAGQPQPVIVQRVQSYAGDIVLACFVLWCCNPLFGLIAFILAS